jgi:Protein tyrosine and serine/threonine kinase
MGVGEGVRVGAYVLARALGDGPGAPWLARAADGTRVVLRAVDAPVDLPDGAGLLPILESVRADDGIWAVVRWCAGGGLDALLVRQRRLTPGECVTVAASVAGALAVLHAAGLAHGDVRASRILLDLDGSVRLDPVGVGTSASPADDVGALGRLLEGALEDSAPPLLRRLLTTCRCPDPAGRPDAAELARLVVRACPSARIRVGRVERPVPPASGPRLRRVAVAVGLMTAVLAAVAAGRAWGGQTAPTGARLPSVGVPSQHSLLPSAGALSAGPRSAGTPSPVRPSVQRSGTPSVVPTDVSVTPRPSPRPQAVGWREIVVGLDSARGVAFAAARARDLNAVDVTGSPASRRDLAAVGVLDRRGVVARGWRPLLEVVTVESRTPRRIVLRVRDRMAPYTLVSADEAVRHRVASRGPRWWRLELRPVQGRWRVWDVRAAGPRT